jgi:hypothetical protein
MPQPSRKRPSRDRDIDALLKDWAFRPGLPLVRKLAGPDGRELLQMRVDMGVLQLEASGRPDGERPHGFDTYYEYLVSLVFEEGETFHLDEDRCIEIDREFYQFYHRRICWLALKDYQRAVRDADHTLRLMDFSSANAPDADWVLMHEQYRPFVMFHRLQSRAFISLEQGNPSEAVSVLDEGLAQLEGLLRQGDDITTYESDAFADKLRQMRGSIVEQFELGPSLTQQLADAIAAEQYERAARIRDQIQNQAR